MGPNEPSPSVLSLGKATLTGLAQRKTPPPDPSDPPQNWRESEPLRELHEKKRDGQTSFSRSGVNSSPAVSELRASFPRSRRWISFNLGPKRTLTALGSSNLKFPI